uniref:Uncharacterized protein n=1 Tax=uncultured sulfate-reducing bacterium TaxID=153939 RepID=Q3IBQ6_9BACT|nr:hypothetical protein 42c90036 [uncultured sulfate-reducing bacterium]
MKRLHLVLAVAGILAAVTVFAAQTESQTDSSLDVESLRTQLLKAEIMRDDGLITDAEYETLRARLIGGASGPQESSVNQAPPPRVCLRYKATGSGGVRQFDTCTDASMESPWMWIGDDSGYRNQMLQVETSMSSPVCFQHSCIGKKGGLTEWTCSSDGRESEWVWVGDDSGYRDQKLRIMSEGEYEVCIKHTRVGRRGLLDSGWVCSANGYESDWVTLSADQGYRKQQLKLKIRMSAGGS